MATQTKEDYLKAIFYMDSKNTDITVTALADEMSVSKPTVNNMVKKLTANGWLHYEKYKPLTITKEGRLAGAKIIRKHRLTEMFLVQIMGFGWEEVHGIAEEMEHLKVDRFFDRMDEILGYPTKDPHGSPIPDKVGNIHREPLKKMSDSRENDTVLLKAVGDSSHSLLKLLNEKNISLGTEFKILKIENFDQSITLAYDSYESVTLSHEVCKRLLVERTS